MRVQVGLIVHRLPFIPLPFPPPPDYWLTISCSHDVALPPFFHYRCILFPSRYQTWPKLMRKLHGEMLVPCILTAPSFFVLLSSCAANNDTAPLIHPKTTYRYVYRCTVCVLCSFLLTFTGLCIPTSLPDNLSSLTALLRALDDLDAMFESIEDAYKVSLKHDKIVLWDERR